jgi:hypothetical protein
MSFDKHCYIFYYYQKVWLTQPNLKQSSLTKLPHQVSTKIKEMQIRNKIASQYLLSTGFIFKN